MFGGLIWPVELGGEVIDPAFGEPEAGVGAEVFVAIEACLDAAGDAGAPNAEGADADAHPRFALFDVLVEAGNKAIDPVAAFGGRFAAAHDFSVLRVGVKIIVEVNAVDVVAVDDVEDDVEDFLLSNFAGGIDPGQGAELDHEFGILAGNMLVVGGNVAAGKGAERVEPRVELEAACVSGLDGEGEGIVAGRNAHFSREPRRPRLER